MPDDAAWTVDANDGEILIHTGVSGRAARMGHRLSIAMARWQATVKWAGAEPVGAELTVEADSLEVRRGEGGIKGLSGPEKAVVKSNAMRSLNTGRYPEIRFTSEHIEPTDDGYRLTGTLHIHGKSREQVIALRTDDLGDTWQMSAKSTVRQSDYGIKPYSLFLGSLQVADDVTVSFTAVHPKDN
jgi:polyisoprenoid-binding protein YceI